MNVMRPTIYLDIDEVLADWLTPTLRLLGHNPQAVFDSWDSLNPRPWNVFNVLHMPEVRAWQIIHEAGAEHWANLPFHRWSRPLYDACCNLGPTYLLTSPSNHSSCAAGKVEWIQRHFGSRFRDYIITPRKHCCAKPGTVLIDDSPRNCAEFMAHGGEIVLFPGRGNDRHAHAAEPLSVVYSDLAALGLNP